jgi:hypothetical protein
VGKGTFFTGKMPVPLLKTSISQLPYSGGCAPFHFALPPGTALTACGGNEKARIRNLRLPITTKIFDELVKIVLYIH